jgi:hypothetical protein
MDFWRQARPIRVRAVDDRGVTRFPTLCPVVNGQDLQVSEEIHREPTNPFVTDATPGWIIPNALELTNGFVNPPSDAPPPLARGVSVTHVVAMAKAVRARFEIMAAP